MDDGDARGAAYEDHCRGSISCARVWPVCCPHCVHPPGDGGAVGISSRPQATLVR